ncbi:hypothetical protein NLJ89_g6946 [Agrocybe chaxingu]|uniref:Acyl-CoA thioesterase-like N-terminal HotDog domain-containing protein n=1 Tax=Agrocybe chaxingu TaxID=84603 RepID=A0A9W8JXM2_9AGAR|nr:hypothetical protein NLJ89_g6946 [Agrocybe chaxingu]
MAPLNAAVKVRPVDANAGPKDKDRHSKLYAGNVDPNWTVGSVTNGGYALALVLEACIQFQSTTPHVDPIHITAYFLRATVPSPFTVCVRTVKVGVGFTNVTAELMQEGVTKIMTHAIFGLNGPSPTDKLNLSLNPPSPYARRHPLHSHPSQAPLKPMDPRWRFHEYVKWTEEPEIRSRNRPDHPKRTNSSTVGGGGLDWFPTMTLSIEFKNKVPPPSLSHADRTVGIYSNGSFMTPPQGRHDIYVEVWSAPSNIGEGQPQENWRDDQVCLAIATQMALALPMEVNERKGNYSSAKL